MVDTQGLLLAAEVTSAQKRDRHIFPELLDHFRSALPKKLHVGADLAYWGTDYATQLKSKYKIDLEIVGTPQLKGYWCRKENKRSIVFKKTVRKFKVQKRR